ncbi:DVU_1556 family methyltransferase [Pseudodesulfovibrio senegalensis]|uniref:Class I SAM-dependent methyltransferase n=1 Tax=Pseudodesulfovibrio senegalensis TaxID=1721087 RepID=A0A6N6N1S6_9BACT|nr:class I SAM-dependent methyltransferase [Pseudodesulfovibrio senegalensis]KAB1441355.1 class I SAM-dependent methyltransferase [Pseudodesulfovibrio senegalensis]
MSLTTNVRIPHWKQPYMRVAAGETLRPGGFALTDRAAALAGLAPGARVLDVGCGTGATVRRLRSRFGAFAIGADNSADQLAEARALPVLCAEGTSLGVASGVMDMVFCECVLSLLTNPRKALDEFYRVLRPGGYLAVADLHALEHEQCADGQACGCAGNAFDARQLTDMASRAGFSIRTREDHSGLLRELAARMVLAGGSPCGAPSGYMLVLAQKRNDDA